MFVSSLSVNPALSPPASCSCTYAPTLFTSELSRNRIGQNREKYQSLQRRSFKRSKEFRLLLMKSCSERLFIAASTNSDSSITEYSEEEGDENPPTSVESEANSKPRRIAIFVEPSPFS